MIVVFKKSLHAFNTHGVISNNSILFSAVLIAIAAVSVMGISNQEAFAAIPPAPAAPTAIMFNSTHVQVTWVLDTITSPAVTSYNVARSTNNNPFAPAVGGTGVSGPSYFNLVNAVPVGQKLVYRVAAVNTDGTSPQSANSTNFIKGTPVAVSNLALSVLNFTAVQLTWSAPPAVALAPIQNYTIYRDLNDGGLSILTTPSGAGTGFVDNTLSPDDKVTYVVVATTNFGTSINSNTPAAVFTPADADGDGITDASDNCPTDPNPGQEDTDLDGIGDVCDTNTDTDGDGIDDEADNCPADPNFDQDDADLDGIGDVCDSTPNGETSTGGSGCFNCAPPTLGYNNIGKKLVDGGFTYNGKVSDAEYYYTPYPLITVTVGQENVAELKIFEDAGPDAIRHVDLGFGLAKGEHMSQSKAVISYDIDFQGNGIISQVDPDNVIDDDSLKINHQKVKCMDSSPDERCLLVRIYHTFRDTLDFDIVATNVWDTKRNSWENLFNHGIHITGDSMNPPKQYDGINKGVIYHLTQTSKTTAVDDLGNSWSLQYGLWTIDYKPVIRNDPANINAEKIWAINHMIKGMTPQQISDLFGYDRNHNKFVEVKDGQMLIAETMMEKVCPDCVATPYGEINDIFYYTVPESMDRLHDIQIINKMKQESDKAQELLLSMK